MNLEDQIAALLAEAEPLRCLPDEEAEAKGLPALVERINALREAQSRQISTPYGPAAPLDALLAAEDAAPKRRGRPPKAKQEGADA